MSTPLVSIVMPLYNKERWVIKTLSSVLNQSISDWELIVIDDGSQDLGPQVVKNFIAKLSRSEKGKFRFVSQENLGQSLARDNGVRLSNGQLLAFIDADDIWHPEKLKAQVDFLQKNKEKGLVITNYVIKNVKNKCDVRTVTFSPLDKKIKSWFDTTGYGGLVESTGLVRREYYDQIGGFSLDIAGGGGLEFTTKAFSDGKLGLINRVLCLYRLMPDGWHANTNDLIKSCEILITRSSIPASYRDSLQLFLPEYLRMRELRSKKSRTSFVLNFFISILACSKSRRVFVWRTGMRLLRSKLDTIFALPEIITLTKLW